MFDLVQEYDAPLPELRLVNRCKLIGARLFERPDASLPDAMPSRAELEATYRFINNQRFDEQQIHAAHRDSTVHRAAQSGAVLAIHDTTEFRFPIHSAEIIRENLAQFSKENQGFFGHHTLVATLDEPREPLGLLRFQPFVHVKDVENEEMQAFWEERGGLFENERFRWLEAVEETEQLLDGTEVLHVMDSEADFYSMLVQLTQQDSRYILRHANPRKCLDGSSSRDGWDDEEIIATRQVYISKRTAKGKPKHKKEHPPRERRQATLSLRARRLELKRAQDPPKGTSRQEWKKARASVAVNAIQVKELSPPEGEEPVEWLLFTSEKIDEAADILFVIDCYLSRWLIEEFFKALKTGCAYSKRQEETAGSLLKMLALSLPIAWFLLRMRILSESKPKAPATVVMQEWEIKLLKKLTPNYKWKRRKATVPDVMGAIAQLGGHHRPKQRVGWMVLGRGFQRFLEQKKGAEVMMQLLGEQDV